MYKTTEFEAPGSSNQQLIIFTDAPFACYGIGFPYWGLNQSATTFS